eukprot:TRINITY_DN13987_c0_g1_i1.p1 TRINITY_DN13987_c0_g1~~TRINITY_DN13987_c0_g1_i1.p1  ORF type:complete len:193 (-),score=34.77 TRINITY_DN13987_c0_g1_i1:338-859(-)
MEDYLTRGAYSDFREGQEGIKASAKKLAAEGGVRYFLVTATILTNLGLLVVGVLSFFHSGAPVLVAKNELEYIVSVYLLVFGATSILVIPDQPEFLKRCGVKWFPFLVTFRGRGVWFIFLGSLACGFGVLGIVFGILSIANGITHIVMACFFKNKLKRKNPYQRLPEPSPDVH